LRQEREKLRDRTCEGLVSLPFLLLPAPLILLAFFSLALERKRRRAMLLDNARKFYSRITVAVPNRFAAKK
jgi:hypothetical protein